MVPSSFLLYSAVMQKPLRSKMRATKKGGAYGEAKQTADFVAHFVRDSAAAAATCDMMEVAPPIPAL